jgi:osmotically inducible protein OsmC
MPTRTACTAWEGGLQDGSGQVELTTSDLGTFEVSFPQRTSDDGGGITNPEELLGASHSASYAMQLSGELDGKNATIRSLEVQADVTVLPDPEGGLRVYTIALKVRGEVEGIDQAGFVEAAEAAKVNCAISKALTGLDITVEAELETA